MQRTYRGRLSRRCEQRGITLSAAQLNRLAHYVELILQWRRSVNLTGLRQADRIIDVLVAESLDFIQRQVLPQTARVLDLGTGAGVPGIPLAICAPDLRLTLLDRSEKKVTFLRHIIPRLQLQNCQPHCDTAETLARHLCRHQRFDAVVTRGVGRVAELLALAAPLLRPGGTLLLRKPQETTEIQEAASRLASATWNDLQTIPVARSESMAWVLVVIWRGTEQVP
ncbi:Ribosomal RNA small subunit methyltransferase G [Candidatus Entotheonellaceae bacterium PAL068K]